MRRREDEDLVKERVPLLGVGVTLRLVGEPFVGERSGSGNSRGWERVETILAVVMDAKAGERYRLDEVNAVCDRN